MSIALPVFGASYYRCASSDLSLLYEAYVSVLILKFEPFRLSLLAFVCQVPGTIRLFLEIDRWPGACRLSFERVLDASISRSSK